VTKSFHYREPARALNLKYGEEILRGDALGGFEQPYGPLGRLFQNGVAMGVDLALEIFGSLSAHGPCCGMFDDGDQSGTTLTSSLERRKFDRFGK
jgi:hypothetical protein